MNDPRETDRALHRLALSTCYFPGCATPVMTRVGEHWVPNVQAVPIRDIRPDAPRYRSELTDRDRARFDNAILLCQPHRIVVERLDAEQYPEEVLREWKASRESGLDALAPLTESQVSAMLESLSPRTLHRTVQVELLGGVHTNLGLETFPLEDLQVTKAVPAFEGRPRLLVINILNTGLAPVTVESVDIHIAFGDTVAVIHNRDDGLSGLSLPAHVGDGDAFQWVIYIGSILESASQMKEKLTGFRTVANLATGESFSSMEFTASSFTHPA